VIFLTFLLASAVTALVAVLGMIALVCAGTGAPFFATVWFLIQEAWRWLDTERGADDE
jgi:hypothetical protein